MTEPYSSSEPGASPGRKEKRGRIIRFFSYLLLVLIALTAYLAYDAYTYLTTPASQEGKEIIITIEQGDTLASVAEKLAKTGAVQSLNRFRILIFFSKKTGTVKVGQYAVNSGWTPPQVLFQITNGQPLLFKLVLREGLTWWETAKQVEEQGFASYDDFVAVVHDPKFLQAFAIPFDTAEGFLFPDTYLLNKPEKLDRAQAEKIAALLVRTFWRKTMPVWKNLPKKAPYPGMEKDTFGSSVVNIGKDKPAPALEDVALLTVHGKEQAKLAAASASNSTKAGTTASLNDLPLSQNATPPDAIITGKGDKATDNATGANATAMNITRPANLTGDLENHGSVGAAPVTNATQMVTANEPVQMGLIDKTGTTQENRVNRANGTNDPTSNASSATIANGTLDALASTNGTTAGTALVSANATLASGKNTQNGKGAQNATSVSKIVVQSTIPETVPRSPAEVDARQLMDLVILASLVEKETGVAAERPLVAGVYTNRLKAGMLLQCDPTVIYGEGENFKGPLRRSQLQKTTNRYNTYQHAGLPPGPISSFGIDAFVSAFIPAQHKYFYFVATGNGPGHTFSKNLQDHNKAVQQYRNRTR